MFVILHNLILHECRYCFSTSLFLRCDVLLAYILFIRDFDISYVRRRLRSAALILVSLVTKRSGLDYSQRPSLICSSIEVSDTVRLALFIFMIAYLNTEMQCTRNDGSILYLFISTGRNWVLQKSIYTYQDRYKAHWK